MINNEATMTQFDFNVFVNQILDGQNDKYIMIVFGVFFLCILLHVFLKRKKNRCNSTSIYKGLNKSREGIISKLNDIFLSNKEKDEILSSLEELLITSDVGVDSTTFLCKKIEEELKNLKDFNKDIVITCLKNKIEEILGEQKNIVFSDETKVIMVVGVNGVGKTTTIAKIASKWKKEGKRVLLVAADTFRAAAVEQLEYWAKEIGADIVKGKANDKPATVVFEAMKKIKEEKYDVVLIDTAGRLQNKSNLMQELTGIQNAVTKNLGKCSDEVILVLDGTSGQNALFQAKEFNAVVKLTGIVITKLDGTAKGGILIAIKRELNIPIYFIGIGEGSDDLISFNPIDFSNALLFSERPKEKDTINSKKRRTLVGNDS